MGTPGNPDWTMTVAGEAHDRVANGVNLSRVVLYEKDGAPSAEWMVSGGPLGTLPDPYSGKIIELSADEGDGPVLVFKGRCERGPGHRWTTLGWARTYGAIGLRAEGNHIPVTDPVSGGDAILFNASRDDRIGYRSELAGRSVGFMVRYTLEGSENASALRDRGIGSWVGFIPGSTATATVEVSGGGLTATITNAGSGYDPLNPPNAVLVGGDGTYTGITVAVDGSGEVTGATINGASGWTLAPEMWISPLPLATLQDLARLTFIPPYAVTVQGDKLLNAVEGIVQSLAPNHTLHVEPGGTIRFLDLREFSPVTLTMNDPDSPAPVDVSNVQIDRSIETAYSRVVIRGGPDVAMMRLTLSEGTLEEYFDHDGLTNSAAKSVWTIRDHTAPEDLAGAQATFGATVNAGAVNAVFVNWPGFGYLPSTVYNLTFSGGGGSGAAANITTNSQGQFVGSATITNGGSGYGSPPTVTGPTPPGSNWDSGEIVSMASTTEATIRPNDPKKSWGSNYWADRLATFWGNSSILPGIDSGYAGQVIANTALAAGGTCQVTFDRPFPSTDYETYRLTGTIGGASVVWTRYRPADADVRANLLTEFVFPVAMRSRDGLAATMTSAPTMNVYYSDSGDPPYQQASPQMLVNPDAGTFTAAKPVVTFFGTAENLELGGEDTDGIPADVEVMAAVRRGNLQVACPADSGSPAGPSYEGTLYTVDGIARTLTVSVPSWRDPAGRARMQDLACEILDSVKDARWSGTVPLLGYDSAFLGFGEALSLDGDGYPTPWGDIAVPVVSCEVTFADGSGAPCRMDLRISNERGAYSAAEYERPDPVGTPIGFGMGYGDSMTFGFSVGQGY